MIENANNLNGEVQKKKMSKGVKIAITLAVIIFVVIPIILVGIGIAIFNILGNQFLDALKGTEEAQLAGREAIIEYLDENYDAKYEIKDYKIEQSSSLFLNKDIVYVADINGENEEFKVYVTISDENTLYTTLDYNEKIKKLTSEFLKLTELPEPENNLSCIYADKLDIELLPCLKNNSLTDITNSDDITAHINLIYSDDIEFNPNDIDLTEFFEKYPNVNVNVVNLISKYREVIDMEELEKDKAWCLYSLDNKNVIKDKIVAKYYTDSQKEHIDIEYEHYTHKIIMEGKAILIYNDHVLSNEILKNEGEISEIRSENGMNFERVGDYYTLKTSVIYNGEGLDEDIYKIKNVKTVNVNNRKVEVTINEIEISEIEIFVNSLMFTDEYIYLSNYNGRMSEIKDLGLANKFIKIIKTPDNIQKTMIGFYVLCENNTSETEETSSVNTDDVSSNFIKNLQISCKNLDKSRVLWYNIYTK